MGREKGREAMSKKRRTSCTLLLVLQTIFTPSLVLRPYAPEPEVPGSQNLNPVITKTISLYSEPVLCAAHYKDELYKPKLTRPIRLTSCCLSLLTLVGLINN